MVGERKAKSSEDASVRLPPPPWLPLLRRLTEVSPEWAVWKNADRALTVSGDIDSISPPSDRFLLLGEFSRWAEHYAMGPIFVCRHLPGSVLGVAVRERRELVELQLCEEAIFRGSPLFTANDVTTLVEMDSRGFRRLRPGAEGLLLLFHNGLKHGGRPALDGVKAERLVRLLKSDPAGAAAATMLFGTVQSSAARLTEAVLSGNWDRRAALRVELWSLARARKNPSLLAERTLYRLRGSRYCPLLPVLRTGRVIGTDVDRLTRRAYQTHEAVDDVA